MSAYFHILALTAPIFLVIALGIVLRRARWLTHEADASLLKITVWFFYPCLILEAVLGNPTLRDPANLFWPPLVGFTTIVLGFGVGYYAGRAFGLTVGTGLRTFAFAVGIYNYGYFPIPLMTGLFGRESIGVLLVHNIGCEAAIWTVGLLVLSGLSLREGWRKIFNPMVFALIAGLGCNLAGLSAHLPLIVMNVIHSLAACAIPLGLLLIGATLDEHLEKPSQLFEARTTLGSSVLRLGLLPLGFLALARWLPCSIELKRVIVVQAAMPAGILPIVIAKHYGGQPLTAVRVIMGTTLLGILVIPLWIHFGLEFAGV